MFIPNFLPFPVLTTRQFVLREIADTDLPLMHELRSDDETNALIGRKTSTALSDTILHIERIKRNVRQNESVYWIICFRDSADLLGTIGLWNFDFNTLTTEIGYELLPRYRGQGMMSEILPRVIEFCFQQLGLREITASCSEKNTGSIQLLLKCGFRRVHSNNDISDADPGIWHFVLIPA